MILDDFPSIPGPPGTERKCNAQTTVLIGYTVASRPGEIMGVCMHLYPGEEVVHLEKNFARDKDPNHARGVTRVSGHLVHGAYSQGK
jgi:hypothetical protein